MTEDPTSPRILVADDDADIRRLVVFALRRRGYRVTEAADGNEAWSLLTADAPDLAIVDVNMPGLTGLEVVERAAADPAAATVPIIILSASARADDVAAGMSRGAVTYVTKPFAPSNLASVVEAVLRSR